jgi:hypothetical protein
MGSDDLHYAATYARMYDAELVNLARSYDSLTETAQTAIREEFARRGLEPPLIETEGPDVAEQRNLITVSRYRDLSEAIVARSMLESAGIPVYLRDENLVRLDWQVSNFIGGIRLQVESSNEKQALELLAQPIQKNIPYSGDDEFVQPSCPSCGSTEITFEGASRKAALASLYAFSLPLPQGRETWTCENCGARWEDMED